MRIALRTCVLGAGQPAVEKRDGTLATSNAARLARPAAATDRAQLARAEAAIDSALVHRFNRGDAAAFVEIVGRHRGRVHAVALRLLHNHADAEEIAQDTFVRAQRGLARFRGESSLATWLHRIAFNLARNRHGYFFRRRRHLTLSLDCPLGPDSTATFNDLLPTGEPDPARQAALDEFVGLVEAGMQNLNAESREILTMRNLGHRSYDQIARSLGTNGGTVKSRIARARGRLREVMAEKASEFPPHAPMNTWLEPARSIARAA